MSRAIEGIKEDELGILIFEISDYYTRISKIFDIIDDKMQKLPDYYQGEPSSKISKYYEEISNKYPILKEKVNIYSNDLTVLIRKMHEADDAFKAKFMEFEEEEKKKKSNLNLEV